MQWLQNGLPLRRCMAARIMIFERAVWRNATDSKSKSVAENCQQEGIGGADIENPAIQFCIYCKFWHCMVLV